jgi:serine/threonine protein kinase/formylglycine-generating enzyme required for sulfatase activity
VQEPDARIKNGGEGGGERLDGFRVRLSDFPLDQRVALAAEWCEGDSSRKHLVRRELRTSARSAGESASEAATGTAPSPPGDRFGDYALIQPLGEGGMGSVHLAQRLRGGERVALKLLPERPGRPAKEVERFLREARASLALDHPGIVRVREVGSVGATHYYAMDFVDGHDLAREIEYVRDERDGKRPAGSPLALPRYRDAEYIPAVVRLCVEIASALQHAHQAGIIHRDVKPQNILLDREGIPYLVDFGLARDERDVHLTMSGDIVGSPAYMSPEQVVGRRKRIDQRVDVYSLGVVLFELLVLRRPFEGRTSREILNAVLEKRPPSLRRLEPRVPVDLETICRRAMARRIDDRYRTIAALAADLERFLALQAIEARPEGPLARIVDIAVRRRTEALIGAACFVLLLAAALYLDHRSRRAPIEQVLAHFESVLATPLVDGGDLAPLFRASAYVHDLERGEHALDAETRRQLAAMRARLDIAHEAETRRGADAMNRASRLEDPVEFELAMAAAFRAFMNAERLKPEPQPIDFLEATYPEVDVRAEDARGRPLDATLALREFDPATSLFLPEVSHGALPKIAMRLRPNYYRFVVRFADGGAREITRYVERRHEPLRLLAIRRDDEERSLDGMARFAATTFTSPCIPERGMECPQAKKPVRLEGFLLDRTEVSNEEYREFALATRRPQPSWWPFESVAFATIAKRPVVGIAYEDMQAYAEWRGKRLPTHLELERAMFGPDAARRRFPWGDEPPPMEAGANFHKVLRDPARPEDVLPHLQAALDVVDGASAAKSLEGCHHLLGNAREATESPSRREIYDETTGALRLGGMDWRMCFVIGLGYDSHAEGNDSPYAHEVVDRARGHSESYGLGFRCARTVEL